MEFAPQSVDVLLLVIHACVLHQMISYCGVCSICTDQEVEVDFNFFIAFSGSGFAPCEPGFVILEVSAGEFMVEEESDVWHCLQFVEEQFVKSSSVGGIIRLKALAPDSE